MTTLEQADKAYQEALCLAGGINATADMLTEVGDEDSGRTSRGLFGIAAMALSIERHLEVIDEYLEVQKRQVDSEPDSKES